ncbi:MAM and LDL-receptor class A domain-containing protein 1-like [Patiria miniata]|uniref:MAM domain-containing protein n=1 Tax=Patiria miniata TaxID=46514 RepID=A0A914AEW7_PATMI|nr:MAM and LDL-receptor class A domain-containing protein 1-like [Patiria miniata]
MAFMWIVCLALASLASSYVSAEEGTIDCDFESTDIYACGYTTDDAPYSQGTAYPWFRRAKYTWSSGTGPWLDHTLQTEEGHFIYLEASYRGEGFKGNLTSVEAKSSAEGSCLSFWYSMWGADMGTLNAYTASADPNGPLGEIRWTRSGPTEKNIWYPASFNIEPNMLFRLRFVGIVGKSHLSDMALDDIKMTDGLCESTEA